MKVRVPRGPLTLSVDRPDAVEGVCADIDGTSDPAACAAAVLEVAAEYLAATGG